MRAARPGVFGSVPVLGTSRNWMSARVGVVDEVAIVELSTYSSVEPPPLKKQPVASSRIRYCKAACEACTAVPPVSVEK
jgi:hypothetical protein